MPQLTPSQARIIDPVLSKYALGYAMPGNVGRNLFPLAPVAMYGGQVIEFGKEAFRLYNTQRAPGSATKRIQFGYQGKPYAIVPSALESVVPREIMQDASVVPGIDLATRSINTVLRNLMLAHENTCGQLARNAANYDVNHLHTLTTGTNSWLVAGTNPSGDIETGKAAIRSSIGVYPNVAIISSKAMAALRYHPAILDRVKYTSAGSITTEILANLWGIKTVLEGGAVVATGAADAFGDVWGTDVILAYTAESESPNMEEPSYGYTYLMEGHPLVEQPYWDPNSKGWVYGVSYDNTPVLSGITAGYLIQNAGT